MSAGAAGGFDRGQSIPVRDAEGLVRLIEAAPAVRRRYQFFVWLQTQLLPLLPHSVAVCGVWRRQLKDLVWDSFHGIVLDDAVLAKMTAVGSPLMQQVVSRWQDRGEGPIALSLRTLAAEADASCRDAWLALSGCGLGHVLAHGVTRPDRPSEVESLFLFVAPGEFPAPACAYYLELLTPHLHAVYLRVQSTERELGGLPLRVRASSPAESAQRWQLTDRERQVLYWVREGKSNVQIAELLEISALTVKNHMQKILRKMGATNRAQAVSMAINANLLRDLRREGRP